MESHPSDDPVSRSLRTPRNEKDEPLPYINGCFGTRNMVPRAFLSTTHLLNLYVWCPPARKFHRNVRFCLQSINVCQELTVADIFQQPDLMSMPNSMQQLNSVRHASHPFLQNQASKPSMCPHQQNPLNSLTTPPQKGMLYTAVGKRKPSNVHDPLMPRPSSGVPGSAQDLGTPIVMGSKVPGTSNDKNTLLALHLNNKKTEARAVAAITVTKNNCHQECT